MIILTDFNKIIKDLSFKHGFSLCGVAECGEADNLNTIFLEKWIADGRNADMSWFNRNRDLRHNPSLFTEDAQTIVVMAFSYKPVIQSDKGYNIAGYAHSTDYHFTLKEKLKKIVEEIKNIYDDKDISAQIFTDSAPVMERYWAVKAGLGWIGKSGMLINKTHGSYLLLCEIILNRKSDIYDTESSFNGCGECRECIKQCPTDAICEDKSIDARRCLSYLTIEHRGDFSEAQKEIIKNSKSNYKWIFGCDECLMCCPWNRKNEPVEPKIEMDVTIPNFKEQYKMTPISRTGKKSILRNMEAY